MLMFAADENFNNDVVRGVRRRDPAIDILTIQDAGLAGADDPNILDWAAQATRRPPHSHALATRATLPLQ